MGTFLKNLINNAANSVSEGIKKRIDDGTFNRMAENVGEGVNSLAAGMVSIVGMAEKAFGSLKDKAADMKTKYDERAERQQAEKEQRQREAAEERAAQLAAMEQERAERQAAGTDDGYKYEFGVTPIDDHIARLAELFDLTDEDVTLFGMARLTAIVGLFFANCDGNYTKRERDCVEAFEQMLIDESFANAVYEDEDGKERELYTSDLFDNIERPYTIGDIIEMTHRLVDDMSETDRKSALESIDYLASQIVEADVREDTNTEDYYEQWRREFGI